MAMKRVVRKSSTFPALLRRICSCMVGILLLLSSLLLLALSSLCRHMKVLLLVWLLVVTVGQLVDFFHQDNKDGFEFSDLVFPHRKFIVRHHHHHHDPAASSTNTDQTVWKTVVRCNNHTNWTLAHWLDENPVVCESEFIKPAASRSVMRPRRPLTPPFKKSKPVQVILLVGEPSSHPTPTMLRSFFKDTHRYLHLYNVTSEQLRIHPNVRWTSLRHSNSNVGGENERNDLVIPSSHLLGDEEQSLDNEHVSSSTHPTLLQFGYISSHFVGGGDNSPVWMLQIPEMSIAASSSVQGWASSNLNRKNQPSSFPLQKQQLQSASTTKNTESSSSAERRRRLLEQTTAAASHDERSIPTTNDIDTMLLPLLGNLPMYYPGISHDKYEIASITWWPSRPTTALFTQKGMTAAKIAGADDYETYLRHTMDSLLQRLGASSAKILLVNDDGDKDQNWRQALKAVGRDYSDNVQSLLFSSPIMGSNDKESVEKWLEQGTALGWNMARLLRHGGSASNHHNR